MKHCEIYLFIKFFFCAFVMVAFCSCEHKYPKSLVSADSLANVCPDSAIYLLDSMEASMASAPKADRMYFRLLKIKAADKAYIEHTSDKDILELVEYYENNGDKKLLPLCYYYAGSVYRDLNNYKKALGFYQKAKKLLPEKGEYKMKSVLAAQMGEVYEWNGMKKETINELLISYNYEKLLNDTAMMTICLKAVGMLYFKIDSIDSCQYYWAKALELARKSNDDKLVSKILGDMSWLDLKQNKKDEALKKVNILKKGDHVDYLNAALVMSDTYMLEEQYDSAFKYCEILVNEGSIHMKRTAYAHLMKIYSAWKDTEKVAECSYMFIKCSDSINKITVIESLASSKSNFDKNVLKEKENKLVKSNNIYRYVLLSVLTVVLLVVIFVIIKMRNQKGNDSIADSTADVSRDDASDSIKSVLSDDVYCRLCDCSNKNEHSSSILNELEAVFDNKYPKFKKAVYAQHIVTQQELRMLMLMKLGFGNNAIAAILNVSASAISKSRLRLSKKMFGNSAGSDELADFIDKL